MINRILDAIKKNRTLSAILLAGIVFRCWNPGWGLPDLFEEATPLTVSWKFWNWGAAGFVFNPNFFNYPAFTFYIQFAVQWVHYIAGHLSGFYPTVNSFGTTIGTVVIPARLVDAVFDMGTVVVGTLIARDLLGRRAAVITAAFLAVNPLLVSEAHLIQTDTALTFFSMTALLFMLRLATAPTMRNYIAAGIAIGLAAGSKYPGFVLIPVLVAAHFLRGRSSNELRELALDKKLSLSVLCTAIVFLATNPYIILNHEGFSRDFAFESYHMSAGHLGIDTSESSIGYYLTGVIPGYLGWLFIAALAAGIVTIAKRGERQAWVLFLYPIAWFILVSTWEMRAARYFLPVVPELIILGAAGIGWIVNLIGKKGAEPNSGQTDAPVSPTNFVMAGIALLLLVQPLWETGKYLNTLSQPDTRSLTRKWISEHVQPGSAVATGPYGVELPDSLYHTLEIPFLAVNSELAAPFYDTRWYDEIDCLITSDFDAARYRKEPGRFRDILPYYDTLEMKWEKIFEAPSGSGQSGPTMRVYRCPDSLRRALFDSTLVLRLQGEPESLRVSTFLKSLDVILFQKGVFAKCEQLESEILKVETDNLELRNRYATVLFLLGKYNPALRQLQLSIQQKPEQADVFALAGRTLLRLERLREAEPTLKRAKAMDGSMLTPYQDLAELYTKTKNREACIAVLQQYQTILPEESAEYQSVAKRLKELGAR
jgi:tetratricopeptide (TPR) repeat protein